MCKCFDGLCGLFLIPSARPKRSVHDKNSVDWYPASLAGAAEAPRGYVAGKNRGTGTGYRIVIFKLFWFEPAGAPLFIFLIGNVIIFYGLQIFLG
jgi:hypothetical protein